MQKFIQSLFLFIPVTGFAFSGSGTNADPYLLRTCSELQNMLGFLNASFQLADNINCSGFDYGDGGGFMPIGSRNLPFTGILDGQDFTISFLNINRPHSDDVGLIGYLAQGSVKNLTVTDSLVIGNSDVGGIMGEAIYGEAITRISYEGEVHGEYFVGGLIGTLAHKEISESHAHATVTTALYGAGGLVGYKHLSDIRNSSAEGEVKTTYFLAGGIGGLVGKSYSNGYNSIEQSFSNTQVTGYDSVGGLIGAAEAENINDSYALGKVQANHYVGGLIGSIDGYNTVVTNSYAATVVNGVIFAGGLIGYTENGVTVNNSYWDTLVSGQYFSAGGIGKSTEEMYQQAAYMNWNFKHIWKINQGLDYPRLQ